MNTSSFRTITPEGRAYCGTEVSLDLHTMDAGTRCCIVAPEREEAVVVFTVVTPWYMVDSSPTASVAPKATRSAVSVPSGAVATLGVTTGVVEPTFSLPHFALSKASTLVRRLATTGEPTRSFCAPTGCGLTVRR
mgnify:CR=1 FL=1